MKDTPTIIWEYDWMPREIFQTCLKLGTSAEIPGRQEASRTFGTANTSRGDIGDGDIPHEKRVL